MPSPTASIQSNDSRYSKRFTLSISASCTLTLVGSRHPFTSIILVLFIFIFNPFLLLCSQVVLINILNRYFVCRVSITINAES